MEDISCRLTKQLEGTTITLRKMGEPGVPTIPEYLAEALPSGGTLGVDGRVISVNTGDEYEKIAADKGGKIQYHQDLIDQIWTDRPELPGSRYLHLALNMQVRPQRANLQESVKR